MSYIEIDHVTKKFKEDTVLYDINVSMEQGKVYGFCGNNGSGKTVLKNSRRELPVLSKARFGLTVRRLARKLIFRLIRA